MLKTYSIYSEGYACTGNSSGASYRGTAEGATFKEACKNLFKGDSNYDAETNSYWACRLFTNESDARGSFG